MMLIIPCTCIEVFKIFLHFKADEKSFHKVIPGIRLNPLFIRKCKVLHVLFHSVSHKFMTLSVRAKSHIPSPIYQNGHYLAPRITPETDLKFMRFN